jgi:hypothetical protein
MGKKKTVTVPMDGPGIKNIMEALDERMGAWPRTATPEEAKKFRKWFVPIKGLQPGDLVRVKKGPDFYKFPGPSDVSEVISVFPAMKDPAVESGSSTFLLELDFSILVITPEGRPRLFAMDSRFFERVK